MTSGRDGFTTWPLLPAGGPVSERNSASAFEVGDDTDIVRAFKRKQPLQLHNTEAPYLTVSRRTHSILITSQLQLTYEPLSPSPETQQSALYAPRYLH